MSTYIDGIAAKVSRLLETDGDALISDKAISPESAANIANAIGCGCMHRYEDTCFEFSQDDLEAEHPLDKILRGEEWELAE